MLCNPCHLVVCLCVCSLSITHKGKVFLNGKPHNGELRLPGAGDAVYVTSPASTLYLGGAGDLPQAAQAPGMVVRANDRIDLGGSRGICIRPRRSTAPGLLLLLSGAVAALAVAALATKRRS